MFSDTMRKAEADDLTDSMSGQADLDALIDDPSAVRVDGVDVKGTVFVFPLDAPLPTEISDILTPGGSLLQRLQPLDSQESTEGFALVPLSGAELLGLERIWRAIVRAKSVAALMDLPGSRYDVLFTQAVRQIGLRRVDWPTIGEQIASRAVAMQRTRDTKPYELTKPSQDLTGEIKASRRGHPTAGALAAQLGLPEDDDADPS